MHNRLRTHTLVALAALALVQLFHLLDVLRYADDAEFPAVLIDPLAISGIGAAIVASLTVATSRRHGAQLSIAAGGAVAIGFVLYHGIPVDLAVNNPYWGPDSDGADAIQWLSVLGAIAAGVTASSLGWQMQRGGQVAVGRSARC